MNKADCFHLGHIAKLHGYKGGVSLFLDVTNPSDYTNLDSLFIDIDNHLTPFFVESFRMSTKGFAVVTFEGVTDENYAKKLLRKAAYLPAEILPELKGTNFYDHEIVGYKVIDTVHGAGHRAVRLIRAMSFTATVVCLSVRPSCPTRRAAAR